MEKTQMTLHTAELDALETALWNYYSKRTTKQAEQEICLRIIKAISQKDEAWLVY